VCVCIIFVSSFKIFERSISIYSLSAVYKVATCKNCSVTHPCDDTCVIITQKRVVFRVASVCKVKAREIELLVKGWVKFG